MIMHGVPGIIHGVPYNGYARLIPDQLIGSKLLYHSCWMPTSNQWPHCWQYKHWNRWIFVGLHETWYCQGRLSNLSVFKLSKLVEMEELRTYCVVLLKDAWTSYWYDDQAEAMLVHEIIYLLRSNSPQWRNVSSFTLPNPFQGNVHSAVRRKLQLLAKSPRRTR